MQSPWQSKQVAFCPEYIKWGQNMWFTSLSEDKHPWSFTKDSPMWSPTKLHSFEIFVYFVLVACLWIGKLSACIAKYYKWDLLYFYFTPSTPPLPPSPQTYTIPNPDSNVVIISRSRCPVGFEAVNIDDSRECPVLEDVLSNNDDSSLWLIKVPYDVS